MTARLVVFARSPELGRVKSRLASSVGEQRALGIYLQLLEQTLATAAASGLAWELWVDGNLQQEDLRRLAAKFHIRPRAQPPGDLGQRLSVVFQRSLPDGPVMVIGSDCPQLAPCHLRQAARGLTGAAEVLLGPAADGGYYLVGLRSVAPSLFTGIPWGSSRVLEKTLEAARLQNLVVQQLPRLRDLDTGADLEWALEEKLVC